MYDEQLKERCENPKHYDRMIALIMQYNPSCKDRDWACDVINLCIRGVTDGGNRDYSTGCCMALRTGSGKVRLFLDPIIPIHNET